MEINYNSTLRTCLGVQAGEHGYWYTGRPLTEEQPSSTRKGHPFPPSMNFGRGDTHGAVREEGDICLASQINTGDQWGDKNVTARSPSHPLIQFLKHLINMG